MKNQLTLLLLLFMYSGLYAQTWFQQNDHWAYLYSAWSNHGFEELTITGDTIIDNQLYQIMHLNRAYRYYQYPNDPAEIWEVDILVYEENEKVFYIDETFGYGEVLLYDFSAQVGDQIPIGNDCDEQYEIVETGIEDFAGEDRRFQRIAVSIPEFYPSDTFKIVEGVGAINNYFFLNQALLCYFDTDSWYFRCHQTDSLQYPDNGEDCNPIANFINSNTEPALNNYISIYPTVSTSTVYIEKKQAIQLKQIQLFSTEGKLVYQTQEDLEVLNLNQLPGGNYHLILTTSEGQYFSKTLVKQ